MRAGKTDPADLLCELEGRALRPEVRANTNQTGEFSKKATVPLSDEQCMNIALAMAKRANPVPNPRVGAVLTKGSELIAWGYHRVAGGPHAEALALARAGKRARGATLYVTLEPCNHFGRTPPCVESIIAAGVERVVIGCRDPNPQVRGGGAFSLERAGVIVQFGAWEADAAALIAEWARRLMDGAAPVGSR